MLTRHRPQGQRGKRKKRQKEKEKEIRSDEEGEGKRTSGDLQRGRKPVRRSVQVEKTRRKRRGM